MLVDEMKAGKTGVNASRHLLPGLSPAGALVRCQIEFVLLNSVIARLHQKKKSPTGTITIDGEPGEETLTTENASILAFALRYNGKSCRRLNLACVPASQRLISSSRPTIEAKLAVHLTGERILQSLRI